MPRITNEKWEIIKSNQSQTKHKKHGTHSKRKEAQKERKSMLKAYRGSVSVVKVGSRSLRVSSVG